MGFAVMGGICPTLVEVPFLRYFIPCAFNPFIPKRSPFIFSWEHDICNHDIVCDPIIVWSVISWKFSSQEFLFLPLVPHLGKQRIILTSRDDLISSVDDSPIILIRWLSHSFWLHDGKVEGAKSILPISITVHGMQMTPLHRKSF